LVSRPRGWLTPASALTGAIALVSSLCLALPTAAPANHSLLEQVTTGPTGGNGAFDAAFGGVSDDGSHAFFVTNESLVAADTDGRQDVYERFGSTTTLVSTGPTGGNGAFDGLFEATSADSSRAIFTTNEPLVATDTDTQYDVYQRAGGLTTLLSTGPVGGNGSFAAFFEGASADAGQVFFTSAEQLTSDDTDSRLDVYKSAGGVTSLVSTGANGDFDAFYAGASKDGSQVFFRTLEKLLPTDTDIQSDIYKRSAGVTTEVSLGSGGTMGNGAFAALFAGVSDDGSRLFFTTREKLDASDTDTGCLDGNTTTLCQDVYQRSGSTTTLLSTGPAGVNASFDSSFAGKSSDGAHVFFTTAEVLVASDTDTKADVYDRSASTTSLVSTGPTGGNGGLAASFDGSSSDGAHVFFDTNEALVAADTDTRRDLYERFGGATSQVSTGPVGGNGAFDAGFDRASSDGARVFFHTNEALVGVDGDTRRDVYERFGAATTLVSTGPLAASPLDAFLAGISTDGTRALFRTKDQLLDADSDNSQDIYRGLAITYDHPASTSSLTVALVPSFRQTISSTQCTSRGGLTSSHQPPFALLSCNPPAFAAGTQAHFGAAASGSAQLTAIPGNLATAADEADVGASASLDDVRASSATGADYDPSPSAPDATLAVKVRITDLLNGASLSQAATVSDLEFPVPMSCTATVGPMGSNCSVTTTVDSVTPGAITEAKASVLAAFRVRLNDAGANGTRGDSDDRNFAMQGIYVR
jgi:hypothetical protein